MNKWKNKEHLIQLLLYAGIGFCVFTGLVLGAFWFYRDDLPPTAELRNFTLRSGSEVYDRNGKMIYLFAFEKRKLVSLKELPDHLIDALIVTEDKNFYRHFGIDIIGNIRALIIDVKRMDFSQGASTITQQMARNMFLTLDKHLSRKIKEAILALRIEGSFSKDEILEIYFNKIFWGGQIHGVETAALQYFGKHAKDLTLPESATLIGMIQRPNFYNPKKFPERTIARRNGILERMYKSGKISEAAYQTAINTPLESGQTSLRQVSSDYFIESIRVYLERKYGTDRLFEGGLRIYTTLDTELTIYADSIMNKHLASFETSRRYSNKFDDITPNRFDINTQYVQGGLVLMDNKNGHVRAIIGGRSFIHSKFNRMTQAKRQPGSAIKPIFYTGAVEKGYTPATVINDGPISLIGGDNKRWTPQNYSKKFYGFTRMRVALQHSYNLWAVKTVIDLGLAAVTDIYKRFGFTQNVTDYSSALGTYEVTPIDLISAYTTFPNDGYRVRPVFITRVEDDKGKVLERAATTRQRVCEADVAYIMNSMLQTVAVSGTGGSSRANHPWQSGGKTGTTDSFNDAWYIGYNKEFTLGIWTGFDQNRTLGSGMSGGVVCAPIWGTIMRKAIMLDNKGRLPNVDDPRYVFSPPPNIDRAMIHPRTGFVVDGGGIDEIFIKGTIPPAVSDTLRFNFYPTRWGFNDEMEWN